MSFKIEISNKVDNKDWNENLMRNKASTGYQIPQWSKIYEEAYGSIPIFLSVRNQSGMIVGQLSAMIHNKLFWTDANIISKILGSKMNLRSILSWFYGPIIHDIENQEKILSIILDKLDEIAIKNKVTMIRGSTPPLFENISGKSFLQHNYERLNWATYITDLQVNEDDYYNSLNKKIRYDIRKSQKNNIEFEIAENESFSKEFSKLKWESRKKAGRKTTIDQKFGSSRWKNMNEKNFGKLFMAKHNGESVGGVYCITFNKNVIQHSVVNSPKKELEAGSYLTWNIIKWCIKNRFLTFDVAGVNPSPIDPKEKQIDFYKSKWGGRKLEYVWYTKIFSSKKIKISSILKNPKKSLSKFS